MVDCRHIEWLGLSGVIVSETKKYLWDDNLDGFTDDEIKVIDNK